MPFIAKCNFIHDGSTYLTGQEVHEDGWEALLANGFIELRTDVPMPEEKPYVEPESSVSDSNELVPEGDVVEDVEDKPKKKKGKK